MDYKSRKINHQWFLTGPEWITILVLANFGIHRACRARTTADHEQRSHHTGQ